MGNYCILQFLCAHVNCFEIAAFYECELTGKPRTVGAAKTGERSCGFLYHEGFGTDLSQDLWWIYALKNMHELTQEESERMNPISPGFAWRLSNKIHFGPD